MGLWDFSRFGLQLLTLTPNLLNSQSFISGWGGKWQPISNFGILADLDSGTKVGNRLSPTPLPQKWNFGILADLDSGSKVGNRLLPSPSKNKWDFGISADVDSGSKVGNWLSSTPTSFPLGNGTFGGILADFDLDQKLEIGCNLTPSASKMTIWAFYEIESFGN